MHETLSQNFIGYIDNLFVEDGNLKFSGWYVTRHAREDVVYYIDIGHPVAFFNYNPRQDVADFYKTSDPNYVNCGFDISIPVNKMDFTVFALVRGQKEVIANVSANQPVVVPAIQSGLVAETFNIKIRSNVFPSIISVDNFYSEPDKVREIALQQEFNPDIRYHKGKRTSKKFIAEGTKQVFEGLIGKKITNWVNYEYNGIFQYCTAEDPLVYHSDMQTYAAAVYLTPNAPVETGTSFFRSKEYPSIRKCHVDDSNYNDVFRGGFYDKTKFELVDTIGNVYNRLVMWDARLIHSATQYFGTNINDSRLFHLFFFDIEE